MLSHDTSLAAPFRLDNLCHLRGTRSARGDALVINLFGGPGSGKSTLASRIFFDMKKAHIEAACPEEHAKLALWSGQPWLLDEQTVLLGRTWETIHALRDKVEVIIVDSPILLCSAYAGDREPFCFHDLVFDLHRRTDRVNLMIERDASYAYSTNGRRENEAQALKADEKIAQTLDAASERYSRITASNLSTGALLAILEDRLKAAA